VRRLRRAGGKAFRAARVVTGDVERPGRDRIVFGVDGFLLFRYDSGPRALHFFRRHSFRREPLRRERGAIEILEEAVQLLRTAPATSIAVYLAGAIPLLVGLLFFWTDMTRNPFAAERLAGESLGAAMLFLWKSVWQAAFEARLYRQLSLSPDQPLKLARLVLVQCALQPLSLLVIPMCSIAVFPFPWSVAFFRNAGLFAALGEVRVIAAARRQAGLWSLQNWILLSLVSLASLLLFANVLIAIALVPQFGRSFLGMEGDFARLGTRLLNSTTLAVAASLMWLGIDPLLDAVYVLRCFHGESLATGEDLRVAFQRAIRAPALILLFCVAMFFTSFVAAPSVRAQVPGQTGSTIDPQQLDRTINEVIRRREFAWRAPHEEGPEPQGKWVGWVRSALDAMGRGVQWVLEHIQDWLRGRPDETKPERSPIERPPIEIWIGLVVLALVAAGIAAFVAGRRKKVVRAQPVRAPEAIDLADEAVTADQMPESSWLKLAEELLAKGDCRLALRALYLAGLNYLSDRELISIRRWKSGREYRRELERRAHALNDMNLTPAFARNVRLFERGWYGRDTVERADVEAFAQGWEEIRRYAARP
jgi:hypothetical protein